MTARTCVWGEPTCLAAAPQRTGCSRRRPVLLEYTWCRVKNRLPANLCGQTINPTGQQQFSTAMSRLATDVRRGRRTRQTNTSGAQITAVLQVAKLHTPEGKGSSNLGDRSRHFFQKIIVCRAGARLALVCFSAAACYASSPRFQRPVVISK